MTAIDRCPKCDQPKGDQARADALPIVREWLASQPRPVRWSDVAAAQAADQPGMCIEGQCRAIDWRARALEAERRLGEAKRIGLEACALVDAAIDNSPDPESADDADQAAIAAGHQRASEFRAALEDL